MRIDVYLTESGHVKSRSRAQSMITSGCVYVNGQVMTKRAYELKEGDHIELRGNDMPFVGRGALKLQAALERFELDVTGMTAIDIGASTGGFTDCLLKRGASYVVAVDSGHGQLDERLASDKRVLSLEGVNARSLTPLTATVIADIIVMDVSFISQTLIHPVLPALLKESGIFISLIKPQFEAGRGLIGKNGIVHSKSAHMLAINRVIESAAACGLVCGGLTRSPVTGGDGNTEYLALFKRDGVGIDEEYINSVVFGKESFGDL